MTGVPRTLVIALHGYEDEPADLADLLEPLDSDGRAVVALRGPIDAPARTGLVHIRRGRTGRVRSCDVRSTCWTSSSTAPRPTTASIAPPWCSAGSPRALWPRWRYALSDAGAAPPFAGLFSISGFLLHAETVDYDIAGLAAGGTRTLVVHGADDEVVAVQQGRSVARLLERRGVPVAYVEVDGDHHLGTIAVDALDAWLSALEI